MQGVKSIAIAVLNGHLSPLYEFRSNIELSIEVHGRLSLYLIIYNDHFIWGKARFTFLKYRKNSIFNLQIEVTPCLEKKTAHIQISKQSTYIHNTLAFPQKFTSPNAKPNQKAKDYV